MSLGYEERRRGTPRRFEVIEPEPSHTGALRCRPRGLGADSVYVLEFAAVDRRVTYQRVRY